MDGAIANFLPIRLPAARVAIADAPPGVLHEHGGHGRHRRHHHGAAGAVPVYGPCRPASHDSELGGRRGGPGAGILTIDIYRRPANRTVGHAVWRVRPRFTNPSTKCRAGKGTAPAVQSAGADPQRSVAPRECRNLAATVRSPLSVASLARRPSGRRHCRGHRAALHRRPNRAAGGPSSRLARGPAPPRAPRLARPTRSRRLSPYWNT